MVASNNINHHTILKMSWKRLLGGRGGVLFLWLMHHIIYTWCHHCLTDGVGAALKSSLSLCVFIVLRWVSWSHLRDRFNRWSSSVRIKRGLWWEPAWRVTLWPLNIPEGYFQDSYDNVVYVVHCVYLVVTSLFRAYLLSLSYNMKSFVARQ